MLTIRSEQMQILGRSVKETSERRIVSRMAREHPQIQENLGRSEFRRVVRLGMAKARRMGCVEFRDIETVTSLVVCFGEFFEVTEPWARPIARARRLSLDRKLLAYEAAASEARLQAALEGGTSDAGDR